MRQSPNQYANSSSLPAGIRAGARSGVTPAGGRPFWAKCPRRGGLPRIDRHNVVPLADESHGVFELVPPLSAHEEDLLGRARGHKVGTASHSLTLSARPTRAILFQPLKLFCGHFKRSHYPGLPDLALIGEQLGLSLSPIIR